MVATRRPDSHDLAARRPAPLWKQPVGGGYASFVVADGRAFTIEQRRDREVVAAYDVQTGRELWTNGWPANFQEAWGATARAPHRPITRVDLRARRRRRAARARCGKGTLVWRRNILTETAPRNVSWGMSASPLIVDDKVIVLPGGTRGNSVVVYNKATGDPDLEGAERRAWYTSPMLVTSAACDRFSSSRPACDGRDGG